MAERERDEPLGEESQQLCRLCLGSESLVWIFDERMEKDVGKIIWTTSGVEILATDIVSQKVCLTCLQITIKMFKFRRTALKNDRDLKEKYKQLDPKNKTASTHAAATSSSSPTHKKLKTSADTDDPPEESEKKAASTSAVGTSPSSSTSKKQKTTADIDDPQKRLSRKDEPKKAIAPVLAPSQPQLRKIHPSVIKMMRDNPDYKFPKMPMNEHYLPVITLLTDEVDNWFKTRNYSDIDIERFKRIAVSYHSNTVVTTKGSCAGSRSRSSSLSSVSSQQQAPTVDATTKRLADVKQLPVVQQAVDKYGNDNKKIRLSSNIIIRPANSVNSESQIHHCHLQTSLTKPTSVSATNINESEDIDGLISQLRSKTGQSSKNSSPSRKEVCDTKLASVKSKLVPGNTSDLTNEAVSSLDSTKNKKDSAINDRRHSSVSETSSPEFRSGGVGSERDSSRPTSRLKKRKKFVIEDSDEDDSNDPDNDDDAEIEMQPHFSHHQQQQQTTTVNDAISVQRSESPPPVARQPEPQQQIRTTSAPASGNVAVPPSKSTGGIAKKQNFLNAMLDSTDLFSFRCTECPATYDRLLDFNLHVRLHADKKALRQYRHNSTDSQKNDASAEANSTAGAAAAQTSEISVVAPSPSPAPSSGSEALVIMSSNEDAPSPMATFDDAPSTSALLVPKNSGNKLFPCKICDSMHYTRKDLKIHVRRRHCRCQFCAARFKTPEERDEHVESRCGITRVHRNLKAVKIKLTRVDLDESIRRRYPEAFRLLARNEVSALEAPLSMSASTTNDSNNEDLLVQEDTWTRPRPAAPQEDVICISDDETSEPAAVTEPVPIREPHSPYSPNHSFRPRITIAGSNILHGVNIHEDDKSIMRYILTKMVHSQDSALERPTDKDIVEGASRKTQILKNLRKQLYKYNIPVEIHYSDRLMVSYKYERSPPKAASDDNWNLLPPKQLLSYREIMARKLLAGSRGGAQSTTSPPVVVDITNDNGSASTGNNSGTVQGQSADGSRTMAPVAMNNAAVKNSSAVGNAHASTSTSGVNRTAPRTFGPAKSKVTATADGNNSGSSNQQDGAPVPRIVSTYVIPTSSPQNISSSTGNMNVGTSSPQQNYLILTMNNEVPLESEAGQPPPTQLPVIQSVHTVNEAPDNPPSYVGLSLQHNGLQPGPPGIVQTAPGRFLTQPTTSNAMVTPQSQITSYNIQTAINNIVRQQYMQQQPAVMSQNDAIQTTSQANNSGLGSTSNGNFVHYNSRPGDISTTTQATGFIQPTAVPQQYAFNAPQQISIVPTATDVINPPPPPPYHVAMSQHQNNQTSTTYSINHPLPRPRLPQQRMQATAPVTNNPMAMPEKPLETTAHIQTSRPRQALLPKNNNEAYKDPRSVVAPQTKDMPTLDFQSQFAQSYAASSDNNDVEQTSAQKQCEPEKRGPCFNIRVKNLSELS